MEYEVRAVDKYLNYSNSAQAGSVKIQTDGVLDKTAWTVETTMTSEDDVAIDSDIEDPDSGYHAEDPGSIGEKKVHSIDRILDQDRTEAGTYHGISEGNAVITIDMHKTEQVTALNFDRIIEHMGRVDHETLDRITEGVKVQVGVFDRYN